MKNLFKKQSAKFVQNPSSFTKVMAKHILVCFLCPTVYNIFIGRKIGYLYEAKGPKLSTLVYAGNRFITAIELVAYG